MSLGTTASVYTLTVPLSTKPVKMDTGEFNGGGGGRINGGVV